MWLGKHQHGQGYYSVGLAKTLNHLNKRDLDSLYVTLALDSSEMHTNVSEENEQFKNACNQSYMACTRSGGN